MGKPCILAIDQGTTNLKAVVFDAKGKLITLASRETPRISPRPGWVEQDPAATMQRLGECAEEVLKEASGRGYELSAVGITNQTESVVLWDRETGEAVYNIINWSCQRTADYCQNLIDLGHEKNIHQKTGLMLESAFSASKIRWVLDNIPGAKEKASRKELLAGTLDTWTAWNLTRGEIFVTDPSNAGRTMLFNIRTGRWDEELFSLFDIQPELLPTVRSSSEVFGVCRHQSFGLGAPISGMIGDQQASLFGLGGIKPGDAKVTYGTGGFLYLNTGHEPVWSDLGIITTIGWKLGEETIFALEGFVITAGSIVQWLRDGLGIIENIEDTESLAASVDDTDGVLFVPALTGLGAPHWKAHAAGAVIGITPGSTKAHIARAALEGICFQVADVVEAMIDGTGEDISWIRADGRAAQNNLLLQMQADILGKEIKRTSLTETTALGAAKMAGLGVGIWEADLAEARYDRNYRPEINEEARAVMRRRWQKAISLIVKWP